MRRAGQKDEVFAAQRQEAIASGRVAAWGLEEIAVSHGISKGHVRNAVNRGDLRASRLGKRIVVIDADLKAWLQKHIIQPETPATEQIA